MADKTINIILVDRDAEMHGRLIGAWLNQSSKDNKEYKVLPIEGIDAALEYLKNNNPDLAIIGLANKAGADLSGRNWGYTTTQDIKPDEYPGELVLRAAKEKGTKIVLFTGHGGSDIMEKYNLQRIIRKPSGLDEMTATIKSALEGN